MGKIWLYGILALALTAAARETPKVEIKPSDYNALETAVTSNKDVRSRSYTGGRLRFSNLELGYSGLHEVTNLDPKTYFGRSALTVGDTIWTTKPAAVVKTVYEGVLDAKAGLRNTSLPAALGCYGWVDLTGNKTGADLTSFFGRELWGGSVELYHSVELPFGKKPAHYTELQLNKDVWKHAAAFGRIETDWKNNTYLLGLTIKK